MVDFQKAFDSIRWEAIWDALDKTSINKAYIRIIKETYKGSRAKIRTNVGTSDFIKIERSVKQGDKLACLLFCLVFAMVVLKTEEENPESGFRIGGYLLSNLGYSDDTGILGTKEDTLQKYLEDFQRNSLEVGLKINVEKTKLMPISKIERSVNIIAGSNTVEQKERYEYLGFKLSTKGDQKEVVSHRISKGWASFKKYSHLLTFKYTNNHTKKKVY